MRRSKAGTDLLGIVAGLGAAIVMSGCNPENEVENANTTSTESTGVPEEVADEVDAISTRLQADALSEAGMRVNARGEKAQFGQGSFASLNIEMIYEAKGAGMVMGPTDAVFEDLSRLLRLKRGNGGAEQGGADQPATAPESKSECSQNPNPESEKRSQ